MFPAGEVSRMSSKGVRDLGYRPASRASLLKTGAPVLPVQYRRTQFADVLRRIDAGQAAGMLLLAREMFGASNCASSSRSAKW